MKGIDFDSISDRYVVSVKFNEFIIFISLGLSLFLFFNFLLNGFQGSRYRLRITLSVRFPMTLFKAFEKDP